MELKPLRGMRDIVDPESAELAALASSFRRVASLYGYKEVIPPTLERFELFALKSGEEIRRTMYVFADKAGREVALRPEVTASVARIYLRLLRGRAKPVRLIYVANCFRYDEPQRGRYREFFQAGAELIGSDDPESDVELIMMLNEYYDTIGLGERRIKIDDVGIHRSIMREAGVPEQEQDKILHLMDKELHDEALREARRRASNPSALGKLEYLVSNRHGGYRVLNELAGKSGGSIAAAASRLRMIADILEEIIGRDRIIIDLGFARGLAYYTGLIYEVMVPGLGLSVAGGGRYDNLIELYGGDHTPATGFAIGLDRTLLALKAEEKSLVEKPCARVLVVPLTRDFLVQALRALGAVHSIGAVAELYHGRTRKLRKILSFASEQGYSHVILIGRREAEEEAVTLRDMASRTQETVGLGELAGKLPCR